MPMTNSILLSFDCTAVAEVLKTLSTCLRDILRKAPSEALLLDQYGRLCLIIDELMFEVSNMR